MVVNYADGETSIKSDACSGDNTLVEYFCSENDVDSETVQCENGCADGACIKDENVTCTDSDGGKEIYAKGTTNSQEDECFVKLNEENSQYLEECSDSNCYVDEQWCDPEKGYQATGIECPNGCSDGACK